MMNILIVSNNDACRSRMAMEILTSFGRGMKVFTAGVLPGNGIPDTVFSVMEQNGYHLSHKKPVDVELYCHQPWDYVVTLCREAEESRKDFDNVVRNWKHFLYTSNPQPIGFSGILLAKRQNSFYCTYFLHNRNVADTKSPYPIKRLEVIRWFNQKSMVFNQSLS